MDFKVFLYTLGCFIATITNANATATCEISDRDDCRYTVTCEFHAGSTTTFECNFSPYVTFIITKSRADPLFTGFFGSTNFDSRVRVIHGIDNDWPTIDTNTFRYYSKTIFMDLAKNNINTLRDDAFKNLLYLESLNLSSNALSILYPRSFALSDSKKNSLKVLDLSNNNISELPNDVFAYVSNVSELYLQNNKISVIDEYSFRGLSSLTHIYLQNNKIANLNGTLTNLIVLRKLDLSSNHMTQLSGHELIGLTSLEYLNASHNLIEYIQSNCFSQTFSLTTVDLSHNRIKSVVENVMFVTNSKLEHLDLYQNMITQIQENAFKNNALKYLNFERNNLTGELNRNICQGLSEIKILDLSNQSLSTIKANTFSDTSSLKYLNISQNFITTIDNSAFEGDLQLEILDVSFNNITSVEFLKNCLPNLTELNLSNNHLSIMKEKAFDSQIRLIRLDLSMNSIVNIEPNSLPLINLQYLNVSENPMTGVIKSNIYSPGKFIRYLDLSYFNITRVAASAFVDLPVLAKLNISHNRIDTIDEENFKGMQNMYSLDLSHNLLNDFQLSNSNLSNLKAFYLNNNKLLNITKTLLYMPNLLYLDLSNNLIKDLSNVPFSNLPNLKILHFTNNCISTFNNQQTNSLVKLTELYLANNEMTTVNLSYFKDLEVVDVSNNRFFPINVSFFKNIDYLQLLDMSNTNITEILPGTFQNVKVLKLLNISHNHLITLRYGSLRGLHRTEVLDLSYNNISDIDVDVFHECSELRILIIDYNNLSSLDVERLINIVPTLRTIYLGGNPISCKEIVQNKNTFSKLRSVEVTSIDKIFHEDNVHGIKCGDKNYTKAHSSTSNESTGNTGSHLLVAWCSILTIVVVVAAAAYFYNSRRQNFYHARQSRVSLGSVMDFTSTSDTHRDLL